MRSGWFGLLIVGASLLLSACAKDDQSIYSNFGRGRNSYERHYERGSGQWSPSDVTLKCSGPHCRPQVGMLVQVESQDATQWSIERCTATLIGPDLVVSAAHCVDQSLSKPVFFLTADGRSARASKIEFWRFTPDVGGKKSDIAPDAVVLRLQNSLAIAPLALASGDRPRYQSLIGLVVNSNSNTDFRIDEIKCPIRRTAEFPFEIEENPELILSIGCNVIGGNSGGPLFAPGSDEIEAVVQANDPTDKRGRGWFTNLRCQPILGRQAANCAPFNKTSMAEHFIGQIEKAAGDIPSFSLDERSQWQTQDEVYQYALKELVGGLPALEVISQPKCLREGLDELTDVRFVDQLVQFDNSTGIFRAALVKSRTVVGRVVSNYKKQYYQIEVDWPAPYATFNKPESHPSVRLGRSFKLEIPRCAR